MGEFQKYLQEAQEVHRVLPDGGMGDPPHFRKIRKTPPPHQDPNPPRGTGTDFFIDEQLVNKQTLLQIMGEFKKYLQEVQRSTQGSPWWG